MSEQQTEIDPRWPAEASVAMRTAGAAMAAVNGLKARIWTPDLPVYRSLDDNGEGSSTFDSGSRRAVVTKSPQEIVEAASRRASRFRFVALPIFAADLAALSVTCVAAYFIATRFVTLPQREFASIEIALLLPILFGNLLTGLYPGACSNPVVEFRQLSRVSAISFLGTALLTCLSHLHAVWFIFFMIAWPLQFVAAPIARFAIRRACRSQRWWGYPVLVFGAGSVAETVTSKLLAHPEYGLRPLVVLTSDPMARRSVCDVPVVGTPRLAAVIAKRLRIKHAIVATPDLSRRESMRVLKRYAKAIRHVMITSAISPFDPGLPLLWRDPRDLAGVAGVEVRNRLLVMTPRMIKRSMDVFITASGGLCLLPMLAVLAVLVRLSSPGPIFFGHTRIGASGQRFKAWKFRSMVTNGPEILREHLDSNPAARAEWERDHKLKNDPRVTKIGALMRRTSLDELPQLWNVFRGDMSLVGPRPIVDAEIAKYGKCYGTYKSVRPGITGLWQVSGRNDTTYAERLQFDEFYVRNWSPWLDMHILARTVTAMSGSRGAY